MADLTAVLKRARKGAAAESAALYFGDALRTDLKRAEVQVETAFAIQDPTALHRAVAEWLAVRRFMRTFDRDIRDGVAAQKEL